MKKTILITVFLFFALIAALLSYKIHKDLTSESDKKTNSSAKKTIPVKIAMARKRDMKDVRIFSGSLKPWSSFEVAPKTSGRLEQLSISIGDKVTKGQLLAQIDDDEYEQQVQQAQAELQITEAQLQESTTRLSLKKKEMNRLKGLFKKNVVAESEHDSKESEYKVQLADLKMKEAQVIYRKAALKAAIVRLSYTKIYADWEEPDKVRFVGERFVDSGAMLNANHPLLTIIDIKRLKATINVIERDYPLLAEGQNAEITTDAYPARTFKGEIYRISKILDERSRQAEVQIEIPNDDLMLKPGMFVRVAIEFSCHKKTQTIPREALITLKGKTGVFQADLKQNKAFFTPVKPGIIEGNSVEIVSPKLSNPVVTVGYHLLTDGADIRVTGNKDKKSEDKK